MGDGEDKFHNRSVGQPELGLVLWTSFSDLLFVYPWFVDRTCGIF